MPAARRSSRRRFDDADWRPQTVVHHPPHDDAAGPAPDDDPDDHHDHHDHHDRDDPDHAEPAWSTYRDAQRGPTPLPPWVVTDPRAIDVDLGVLKTGKEADVSLVERAVSDDVRDVVGARRTLMAVKRYRSAEHRMFHRDAGYLEGRRVRKSREMRAMATRTDYGRELIAGQWASAEFAVLSLLWRRGAAVPYPVQLHGNELMMEFIGTRDGVAAPRLAQLRPGREDGIDLYRQTFAVLRDLADAGYAHGDLSPYNLLVHDGRLVVIDVPQAVDLVGNPQGFEYLRRDCANICRWFASHGVAHADEHDLQQRLLRSVPGLERYA